MGQVPAVYRTPFVTYPMIPEFMAKLGTLFSHSFEHIEVSWPMSQRDFLFYFEKAPPSSLTLPSAFSRYGLASTIFRMLVRCVE
jgi:hypothetical protein